MKVGEFGETARPAFSALRPAVREIDDANAELRPLAEAGRAGPAREGAPVRGPRAALRPRPEPRRARPRPAQPDLRDSFFQFNRLFNMAAYNPGGQEG